MKIQDISYYYRTPFYVVRNDLKKINGLFVFLPELLYDKTLAALDEEDDSNLEKLFGPRWQELLMPSLDVFLSKDGELNGPTEIDDDKYFYEPSWSCDDVKFYYITEQIALIAMGILKSDNFIIIRRKIMAVMSVSVFAQSLCTLDIPEDVQHEIDLNDVDDSEKIETIDSTSINRESPNTRTLTIKKLKELRALEIEKDNWKANVSKNVLKFLDNDYEAPKITSEYYH